MSTTIFMLVERHQLEQVKQVVEQAKVGRHLTNHQSENFVIFSYIQAKHSMYIEHTCHAFPPATGGLALQSGASAPAKRTLLLNVRP